MQLTGKLFKPDDVVELIDLLNEKGEGCLILSFLHPFKEVKFCVKDGKVYFNGEDKLPADVYLKILVEDWWLNKRHPYFKVSKDVVCSWNSFVTIDDLKKFVSAQNLKRLNSLPREFVVEKVGNSVPKFLKAVQLAQKPITFEDLHSHGVSLLDLVDWIDEKVVTIKPYKEGAFANAVFRVVFSVLLLVVLVLVVLPKNYDRLAVLEKRNEIMNEILVKKVLEKPIDKSAVCSGKLMVEGGKVFIETKFGRYFVGQLPKSGYVPFFEVPAK
ncbi:hypothetical protein SAMN06265339_0378 [Desulfurobacterium pacificum]|uniref:DUF4388 domain-containing protein n=1 Tax=Desulfurobacterium pacificum TaxID=240166 RepID=A0ABY1NCK3_9BACT|nr:hypothetical protein [Desulfurobacterium pacificum]SMP06471.1 hypothetical protein SAMN06265339_0378 [Desulfurobacterium pacificum]